MMCYMPDDDQTKSRGLHVRIPPDLMEQIEALTTEEVSRGAVVRTALRAYFKAKAQQKR